MIDYNTHICVYFYSIAPGRADIDKDTGEVLNNE